MTPANPYFETFGFARNEDETRVKLLTRTLQDGLDPCSKTGLLSPRRRSEIEKLSDRLNRGVDTGHPVETLASSLFMRELRAEVIGALLDAVTDTPDDDLRVVTVVNQNWCIDAADLDNVTARTIKGQFRTHLERAGVLALPGMLVGFLHGEFEQNSQTFQLHFHLLTTTQKSHALLDGLRGRWGYEKTLTGAVPIKRQRVKDRREQFSYLLKAYWPQRDIFMIDGIIRRRRNATRIPIPHHNHYLAWINRQKFAEIQLINNVIYRNGKYYLLSR